MVLTIELQSGDGNGVDSKVLKKFQGLIVSYLFLIVSGAKVYWWWVQFLGGYGSRVGIRTERSYRLIEKDSKKRLIF